VRAQNRTATTEVDRMERPLTVLVLDDDLDVRRVVALILRLEGHLALEGGSVVEAVEVVSGHPGVIDVLLVDAGLLQPGDDVESLLTCRPRPRVLYCSGHPRDHLVERGVLPPDADFLAKPFAFPQLCATMRRLVAGMPGPGAALEV
jgi:DNA-binding NtrC family response regulator